MHVITFDLNTKCLKKGNNSTRAYNDIKSFLIKNGFKWAQGSVYFAGEDMTAVECVLVIQKLAKIYPWLSTCAKDVRMLRVEEDCDLRPALGTDKTAAD